MAIYTYYAHKNIDFFFMHIQFCILFDLLLHLLDIHIYFYSILFAFQLAFEYTKANDNIHKIEDF